MITVEKLEDAIFEAERFLERAEKALSKVAKKGPYSCPKETGAVHRASMDLARTLAALRSSQK